MVVTVVLTTTSETERDAFARAIFAMSTPEMAAGEANFSACSEQVVQTTMRAPPPPAAPPPLAFAVVVVTFDVAGSVDDFADSRSDVAANMATLIGVDEAAVALRVTPASVHLEMHLCVWNGDSFSGLEQPKAERIVAELVTQLDSVEAVASRLGVAAETVPQVSLGEGSLAQEVCNCAPDVQSTEGGLCHSALLPPSSPPEETWYNDEAKQTLEDAFAMPGAGTVALLAVLLSLCCCCCIWRRLLPAQAPASASRGGAPPDGEGRAPKHL